MNDMTETSLYPVVPANVPPSVNIIACGGAGINMLRLALPEIAGRVTYTRLDTSNANLQAGEAATIIGGGGSGLVRNLNADVAVRTIAGLSDDALNLADVNIVMCSLSGGSGSVIGPLIVGDIASRRKRMVILLTIASTQSERHTINTLNTLQSLRKIADNSKLYLPTTIFNNGISGQKAVDQAFVYKLSRLVDLLTAPTVEIDKHDRLHWLNVPKTLDASLTGLRLLRVETLAGTKEYSNTEIWPDAAGHIYDSLLSIGTEQYPVETRPRARASFEGMFTTIKLVPMYGVIGNPPKAFDDLVKTINDTLNDYRANTESHDDPFAVGDVHANRSGLVL